MPRLVIACLLTTAVLTGCGGQRSNDPLQATDTLVAATPAEAPAATDAPPGTIIATRPSEVTAFDPASGTLAVASGDTLSLIDARDPHRPPRTSTLPSAPAALRVDNGSFLAALPETDLVATIDPNTGQIDRIPVTGGPLDAVHTGGYLAVALREHGSVAFLRDGNVQHTTEGFQDPARLLSSGDDLFVLDRLTTSLTPVDVRTGNEEPALRAGQGATNAVSDRHGRILVTDTRQNEYLAFSTQPFVLKQRYPVPSAPYDIAYDPQRDLAWITLTRSNEVVAYDVAGGQPERRHRIPTVHQPNSVEVDPETGAVLITSATGQGTQVVRV